MPVSLEKYAELLDQRGEPAPIGPALVPFDRAKPHVPMMLDVAAVVFSTYGTLLFLSGGKPYFLNPDETMRQIALEKTIREFKMWHSMSRKPGEPWQYMASMFQQVLDAQIGGVMTGKDAVARIDRVWLGVLDRLEKKEYVYDASFYGPPEEFAQKIAYFYLRASQGVTTAPAALATLRTLKEAGLFTGVFGEAQCNTPVQLLRGLAGQGAVSSLEDVFDAGLCVWPFLAGIAADSDRGFSLLVKALADKGIPPAQCLYVGSKADAEIAPAKRRGFRTALALLDKMTAEVRPEQLKDPKTRPDALVTGLEQLTKVVAKG